MTTSEKRALVRRLQAGKRRARRGRPSRLREVERRMDALGREYKAAKTPQERRAIRRELRDLGQERMRLRWPS